MWISQERPISITIETLNECPIFTAGIYYVTDNADEVASIIGSVPVEINTVLITYDCVRVKVHSCA